MLDRPFSDVCSTVSCWALIFSVILPSMQVMGVKVTTPDASPTTATSEPQQQHYHLQKHSHQQQQFLLKTSTFSLTVYLDPTTFQQTLPPMTFLSDSSPSSSNNKNSAPSASPSSPKSHLVKNGSRKEQQNQQLPHPEINQRSSVVGQDVNPSSPARGFSVESDTDNHAEQHYNYDTTAAQREEEEKERRIGLGISKGPHRHSRHRYPHTLIHRLYNNNNRPLREGSSSRRMATMPKTTTKSFTTTRRIEIKKRSSRLQRLLLDQQEHDVDENYWPNAINHNNNHHHHQQQEQQRQRRNGAPAREDDLSFYSIDGTLVDMMNFILDDEELSEYFLANDNRPHSTSINDDNHLNDSPTFETKQQPQHTLSTPAPTFSSTSSSSSSFVSPSLSGWTQNDIDMARALWDYWEELDAMDLIQAQLESQLDGEDDDNHEVIDNIEYETRHSRQAHLRQRPEPQPFGSTLWRGNVKALVKEATSNMSSPVEWMHDSISGPMMRFPFSGPMPIMPQNWIALMPCPVGESPEFDPDQTGRKTPTLPLNASAIVFYATTSGDCRGYAETVVGEGESLPPVMVLDALSAETLILTLDSLSYGTTAMASLSMTDLDSNATVTGISTPPIRADDNDNEAAIDAGTGEESTTLDSLDTIEKEELPKKLATRPLRRQIVISMPELATMVDSFTAGAAIRARRVLVNLGLDTQDTDTDEQLDANDDRREMGRDDADYYRPLTGAMLLKNGGAGARKGAYFGSEAVDVDSHGQEHDSGQDKEKDKGKEKEGTVSRAFILQRHSKTRTRPNRLSQRGHQASTHSQLLDQVQSLMLLKEYPQYSRGHQSLHHHLSGLQQNNNNNNLPLTHPSNTTLSGKVAMVLMSIVCGIGVGMFGALLFVVALKVRLFQSRRSNNSGSGLHPLRHATAAQQQQAHQQMRESGVKKVIPLGVLESYGVQTVLQTSDATVVLTAVSEKSKAKMALLSKGPKTYAEDVIEMEEGLEDAEARANARRLRLERRRNRVGGQGQLRLGRDIEEEEDEEEEGESGSGSDEEEYDDDDVDEDLDQDERDRYQEHGQYNGEENDDQVVPEMRSSRDGGAMDIEQITAAIMTATRQGSYRRVSYSHQGHLNDSTSSLSSSYSSSSVSSSSGSGSSSSSHSMERALTSSFSSSLSRSENPQGCTHSITHSHSHEQRRRTRSSRRRKTNTKGDKASAEAKKKEELPFANANAQTMCSICLDEYEVGEQVRTLPCYHQYHKGCIDPWLLNVAALCPICKRDLFPSP